MLPVVLELGVLLGIDPDDPEAPGLLASDLGRVRGCLVVGTSLGRRAWRASSVNILSNLGRGGRFEGIRLERAFFSFPNSLRNYHRVTY